MHRLTKGILYTIYNVKCSLIIRVVCPFCWWHSLKSQNKCGHHKLLVLYISHIFHIFDLIQIHSSRSEFGALTSDFGSPRVLYNSSWFSKEIKATAFSTTSELTIHCGSGHLCEQGENSRWTRSASFIPTYPWIRSARILKRRGNMHPTFITTSVIYQCRRLSKLLNSTAQVCIKPYIQHKSFNALLQLINWIYPQDLIMPITIVRKVIPHFYRQSVILSKMQ